MSTNGQDVHERRSLSTIEPLDSITANRIQNAVEQMERHQASLALNSSPTSMRARYAALAGINDPRRDLNAECGYPDTSALDANKYREEYDRNCIATRVVQFLPEECWKVQPEVYEVEDPEVETPFEIAWKQVAKRLRGNSKFQDEEGNPIWEILQRGDMLSGIGHFGVLLLGFDDGKDLLEPVDGFTDNDAPELEPEEEGVLPEDMEGIGDAAPDEDGIDQTDVETDEEVSDDTSEEEELEGPAGLFEKKKKPPTSNFAPPRPGYGAPTAKKGDEESDTEDSDPADVPVKGDNGPVAGKPQVEKNDPNKIDAVIKTKRKLLFVRAFDESLVQVTQWVTEPKSPRYGMPKMYAITFNDPRDQQNGAGMNIQTANVHWSRVIHIADNLGSSEVAGVPRMRPVWDRLLDIRKYFGGGAESAWRGAFPGLSFETHPQLGGDVTIDQTAVKEAAERYGNTLQRYLVTEGMSVKSLAPQVVDCSPQLKQEIEAICIALGVPIRIFMGSERGELASGQDDSTWNDRVRGRQSSYLTPRLIVPIVDRLIHAGVLPMPKGFSVAWPDPDNLSPTEKADLAVKMVDAVSKYIAGDCESLVTPVDFFVNFLGFDEEEANSMLEGANLRMEEQVAEEAADGLMQMRGKQAEDKEAEMDMQIEQAKAGGGPPGFPPKKPGGFPPKGKKPGAGPTKPPFVPSANELADNSGCGAGSDGDPGFQPGNDCAREGSTWRSLKPLAHSDWKDVEPDEKYLYHATSLGNASDIAAGELEPHDPSYGTDQEEWPDGSIDDRSYFTHSPGVAYSFAPEEGVPVLLRVPRTASKFKKESTGDYYTKGKIAGSNLEIAVEDGWVRLADITGNASDCGAGKQGSPGFEKGNDCAADEGSLDNHPAVRALREERKREEEERDERLGRSERLGRGVHHPETQAWLDSLPEDKPKPVEKKSSKGYQSKARVLTISPEMWNILDPETMDHYENPEDVPVTIEEVLGGLTGESDLQQVASLVGAPHNSRVDIGLETNNEGEFVIRAQISDYNEYGEYTYTATRFIGRDSSNDLYISNEEFTVEPEAQGKGLGTTIFSQQVSAAKAAGFKYIRTYAIRRNDGGANGYYTWPRLGYDAPLEAIYGSGQALNPALEEGNYLFPEAETVLDIFDEPGGRDWWRKNGISIPDAKFDLTTGSRSLKVLDAYLQERKKRG